MQVYSLPSFSSFSPSQMVKSLTTQSMKIRKQTFTEMDKLYQSSRSKIKKMTKIDQNTKMNL